MISEFYVHGSVHCESMSIIVQQDATVHSFIIFLQTAVHISDDTLIHHQEHTQTVITTSGTCWTVFATALWRGGVGTPTPRQRMVANTVWPMPDVVITVWVCSWWWMRVSSETCRAVCRNIIQLYIVTSRWTIIDNDKWDLGCPQPFYLEFRSSGMWCCVTPKILRQCSAFEKMASTLHPIPEDLNPPPYLDS